MRHLILVFLGLVAMVHTKTDLESCFDAADPMSDCCEVHLNNVVFTVFKKCREKFPNSDKCDFEICYAEERGFIFSNGTIDHPTLEHVLESDFSNYGSTFSIIKQNCLNVDITEYGETESCYLKKLSNCMTFFVLSNCPKWSDEQRCSKAKSASEECAKMLT